MVIYKIVNLTTGKIYVGQDTKNKKNYFGSGQYIKLAIKKHGIKNFKKKILDYCTSQKELNERERYWIRQLNTLHPLGYNLTAGGKGISGYKFTREQRKRISDALIGKSSGKPSPLLGRSLSLSHKKKLSRALKNKKKKPFTKMHKEKISEAQKGKPLMERGHKENCQCCMCKARRGETHIVAEGTKQKIRKALLGREHSEERKQAIKIGIKLKQLNIVLMNNF